MSGPVDDDDDELEAKVSPREQAEAARLARLVDDLLDGAPAPAAMESETRLLLQAAQRIRDAGPPAMAPARREAVLDAAFARWPRARVWPWVAATVLAAAAAFVLALRPPSPRVADELVSRPADRLVGRIAAADSAAARARADLLYADRLAGYRRIVLRGGSR